MSLHFELRRQQAGQYDPYDDYNADKSGWSQSYNDCDADYSPSRSSNKASNEEPPYLNFIDGRSHLIKQNTRKAIAAFTEAINYDPFYAEAWFYRGKAYHSLDNLTLAIADYSQAITYKSEYAEAYGNRGCALIKLYKQNAVRSQFYHFERGRNDLKIAAKLFQSQGNMVNYEKAILLLQRYV